MSDVTIEIQIKNESNNEHVGHAACDPILSAGVTCHTDPAFIKVGKTPATQNLVLEQYAVKIGNSTLFLFDNYINLP